MKTWLNHNCPHCKLDYKTIQPAAIYCSQTCRQQAYVLRRDAKLAKQGIVIPVKQAVKQVYQQVQPEPPKVKDYIVCDECNYPASTFFEISPISDHTALRGMRFCERCYNDLKKTRGTYGLYGDCFTFDKTWKQLHL